MGCLTQSKPGANCSAVGCLSLLGYVMSTWRAPHVHQLGHFVHFCSAPCVFGTFIVTTPLMTCSVVTVHCVITQCTTMAAHFQTYLRHGMRSWRRFHCFNLPCTIGSQIEHVLYCTRALASSMRALSACTLWNQWTAERIYSVHCKFNHLCICSVHRRVH